MDFDLSWKRLGRGERAWIPFLRLLALAAWMMGLLVLVQAGVRSRETPERVRSRLGELNVLAAQDARLSVWQGAAESFTSQVHSAKPYDLPGQAAQAVGGPETNQVRELSRTRVAGGWDVVRVQVRAENMTLAALSPLIEGGESADPPWRLVSFSVEPLSPKPGRGRVELDFETLMRVQSTDTR